MRALLVIALVAGCGGSQAQDERPASTECRSAGERYAALAFREFGDVSGRPDRVLIENVEAECREIWTRDEYVCVRTALTLQAANACLG